MQELITIIKNLQNVESYLDMIIESKELDNDILEEIDGVRRYLSSLINYIQENETNLSLYAHKMRRKASNSAVYMDNILKTFSDFRNSLYNYYVSFTEIERNYSFIDIPEYLQDGINNITQNIGNLFEAVSESNQKLLNDEVSVIEPEDQMDLMYSSSDLLNLSISNIYESVEILNKLKTDDETSEEYLSVIVNGLEEVGRYLEDIYNS